MTFLVFPSKHIIIIIIIIAILQFGFTKYPIPSRSNRRSKTIPDFNFSASHYISLMFNTEKDL